MYWMLGTGDVYVYFGETYPAISYCGFNDSFATKLLVFLSIGFALIRACKPCNSPIKQGNNGHSIPGNVSSNAVMSVVNVTIQ